MTSGELSGPEAAQLYQRLQAIDRELQMFKNDAGAPRAIQLGCTRIAHEHFDFCNACAIKPNEVLCWRLLAIRDAELKRSRGG